MATGFTLSLGALAGAACHASAEPASPAPVSSVTPAPGALADSFSKTRAVTVDEINQLGNPLKVSGLYTNLRPGAPLPNEASVSWDMGAHHYELDWEKDPSGRQTEIDGTINDREGHQVKWVEQIVRDGNRSYISQVSYEGTDGQYIPINDLNARVSADKLLSTMTTMALAVSGEPYTPEQDWQTDTATPTPTPSPTPSVTEKPAPTKAPSLTPAPQPDTEGMTITLMSQNVWGMQHPGAGRNWQGRMDKVSSILLKSDADFATLQEARPKQVQRIKRRIGSHYKSYPGRYVSRNRLSDRTILYKALDDKGKPLWQLKDHGAISLPNYGDSTLKHSTRTAPWGQFVNAQTGQEVILTSVHPVAYDGFLDRGGALKREKAGHVIAKWARNMKVRYVNATVIASGDFNSTDYLRSKDRALHGNRERSIPCIVGQELRAIDDIETKRDDTCPVSSHKIDQAYTNADDILDIQYVDHKQSDHPGLLARIKLRNN